ncbi:hypothetical protein HCZ22_05080 [Limosilactobacillus fermentum]|nr:hypothetical protein [Limosilactobacillus fermentum]MDQ2152353.1 hypothetical protein [Limosilactobacillus fermentum]QID94117.1 hypothetical protein GJA14_10085 [Limosilactobacillus fermentum]UTF47388.1 hypothetical protein NHN16_09940 [Limosilactobacillus fermentum]
MASGHLLGDLNDRDGGFNSEKSIYAQRLNQNDYYGATLTTLVAVEGWK